MTDLLALASRVEGALTRLLHFAAVAFLCVGLPWLLLMVTPR